MWKHLAITAVLMTATVAVYWPAVSFDFVYLDDPDNVTHNSLVRGGLTPDGVLTAFKTRKPDYWRPVCWLSLMLDYELYGDDPRGYHLTNIVLHAMAACLLYAAMASLTRRAWLSMFITAAFALHPTKVESVAWVTERKDVLSGLFFALTLLAYAAYGRSGGIVRYGLVASFLALGLMSKSMLVTTPAILLLLDLWPLKRLSPEDSPGTFLRRFAGLLAEKIPLFMMSAAVALATARSGRWSFVDIPVTSRIANAAVSYVRYMKSLVLPADLVVYYPLPGFYGCRAWTSLEVIAAWGLLATATALALWQLRRRPYLAVGWLWFLGMLVPVIGVWQVGHQGMADRFTYLPAIGLLMVIGVVIADWAENGRGRRQAAGIAAVCILGWWAVLTGRQLPVWRNTDTLYEHALSIESDNWKIRDYYGDYLASQQKWTQAIEHYHIALRINPAPAKTHFMLGHCLASTRENSQARDAFKRAIEIDPNYMEAHYGLGIVLALRNDNQLAAAHLRRALELATDPIKADEIRAKLALVKSR